MGQQQHARRTAEEPGGGDERGEQVSVSASAPRRAEELQDASGSCDRQTSCARRRPAAGATAAGAAGRRRSAAAASDAGLDRHQHDRDEHEQQRERAERSALRCSAR